MEDTEEGGKSQDSFPAQGRGGGQSIQCQRYVTAHFEMVFRTTDLLSEN